MNTFIYFYHDTCKHIKGFDKHYKYDDIEKLYYYFKANGQDLANNFADNFIEISQKYKTCLLKDYLIQHGLTIEEAWKQIHALEWEQTWKEKDIEWNYTDKYMLKIWQLAGNFNVLYLSH